MPSVSSLRQKVKELCERREAVGCTVVVLVLGFEEFLSHVFLEVNEVNEVREVKEVWEERYRDAIEYHALSIKRCAFR